MYPYQFNCWDMIIVCIFVLIIIIIYIYIYVCVEFCCSIFVSSLTIINGFVKPLNYNN